MKQKNLGSRLLGQGRFLNLKEIEFSDDRGRLRRWEAADRNGEGAASFILARLMPDDEWLFVRQYRPPAGRLMLEFPAGLIDPGESAEETAIRELYEETGYRGKITRVCRPGFSSPGLTGEPITLVFMEIDAEAYRGRNVEPHPEDTECIEVFRVPRASLCSFVAEQEAAGVGIDSKIYTLLAGMFWLD